MRVFLKERLKDDEDGDHHHHGTHHQEDDDSMLAEPILHDKTIKTQVFIKKQSSLKDMISLMKTRYIYLYMCVCVCM